MKMKIVLATMISIATSATFAAPKLYGEIDASLDYLPEKNATTADRDVWKVNSNSSFLGIKGEEKLTDRLSAVYLAEWAFNADGDGTDWSQRNRYVGLKDEKLGTIKIGKHNTPVKELSSAVDSFNNYVRNKADIDGIMTGENRINNVIVYETPEIELLGGSVEWSALLATGEAQGIKDANGGKTVDGRGLGDAWSTSLTYTNPMILAGIGYEKAMPSDFLGHGVLNATDTKTDVDDVLAAADTLRLTGRLTPVKGLALKALFQTSKVSDAKGNDVGAANIDRSVGWLVGGEYRFPNAEQWNLRAQYSKNSTSFKNADADFDAEQIMAGVDYSFNKQVRLYGYTGYSTFKQANTKDTQPLVGTGLEFKF